MDGGRSYSDHEKQIIALTISLSPGEDYDSFTQFEPLGKRGLDPDEVAELVSLHRVMGAASGESELALGINQQEFDAPTQAAGNVQEGRELTANDTPGGKVSSVANYEELSVLDFASTGANPINQQKAVLERDFNFADQYGEGPYVDASDDLSVHAEFSHEGSSTADTFFGIYELMWNVTQAPDGVPQFSAPI